MLEKAIALGLMEASQWDRYTEIPSFKKTAADPDLKTRWHSKRRPVKAEDDPTGMVAGHKLKTLEKRLGRLDDFKDNVRWNRLRTVAKSIGQEQ